jgi:hypothetical protein
MTEDFQKDQQADLADILRNAQMRRSDELGGWLRDFIKRRKESSTSSTPQPGRVVPAT